MFHKSGFKIDMRYAPELTAFEVWLSYYHPKLDVSKLVFEFKTVNEDTGLMSTGWNGYGAAVSAPPTFILPSEDTYNLARELLLHGPYKPDKVEPDMEQIEWLRSQVERTIFPVDKVRPS